MSSGKNTMKLRITAPDGTVRESAFDTDNLILGSGPGAAVQLADPKVSGVHLMLKVEKNGLVKAIDLGSEGGTRIGNRLVQEPTTVEQGEVIGIGASRVEVLFDPPHLSAKPSPWLGSGAHHAGAHAVLAEAIAPAAAAPADVELPAPVAFPLVPSASPETKGRRALQVALAWGDRLLDVQHFGPGYAVTIGEGRRNDFRVFSSSVGQSFQLAKLAKKGKISVSPPPGARVEKNGAAHPFLHVAGQPLLLDAGEAARLDVGEVSLLVRQVLVPPQVKVKGEGHDWTFFTIGTLCLLAGTAAVIAFLVTPRSAGNAADSLREDDRAQLVKLLIKPARTFEPVKRFRAREEKSGAEEGVKAKGEEGKLGKTEAFKDQADPSKPGSPQYDPNKKEKDRRKVARTGLLAQFGAGDPRGSSDIRGPGGIGSGINEAFGGRKGGAGFGDARGLAGLGTRGTGSGGGGTGLGMGGLGTKGDGRGAGGAGLDLGGKGYDTVKVIPGTTRVVGGLPKEVIERVIRSHYQEIKYCYETELQRAPDLTGKVAVGFTIGGDGSVTAANVAETSLSNPNVEQCMLARIRRWKFPEVPGGGVVDVNYPWVFKPAG